MDMDFQQINLYLPASLCISTKLELNGYFEKHDGFFNIYICENKQESNTNISCCTEWNILNTEHKILGKLKADDDNKYHHHSNLFYLDVDKNNKVFMFYLRVNGEEYNLASKKIFVLSYDHSSFLKTENINSKYETDVLEPMNQFETLDMVVKHSCGSCWKNSNYYVTSESDINRWWIVTYFYRVVNYLYGYSNLCVQIQCFIRSFTWVYHSIRKEKRISVTTGCLLTSLLIDSLCGVLVLYLLSHLSITPGNNFYYVIEIIVNNLRSLLQWLMGSPAGLKLNHAFNSMLGKFFLYHIGLWWMFLVIVKSFLEQALIIAQYVGLIGITFQTAILADLLSLSSFHVYCIYTYAARLYNIQMSGLIALWRLFLGRKHNPLRGGVDSCQYNHHQLFVGTLAFTILLFLLPTTFLYYIVFTSFRVILVLLGGFLMRLRYFVQSLPLYLIALWFIRSPRIAGNIKVIVNSDEEDSSSHVYFQVILQTPSLLHLISKYHPLPVVIPQPIQWKQLISCLCRGHLLYPV